MGDMSPEEPNLVAITKLKGFLGMQCVSFRSSILIPTRSYSFATSIDQARYDLGSGTTSDRELSMDALYPFLRPF